MSLKYKKISEFFGVGVGVEKKFSSKSELESEPKKNFFGVGVGFRNQKVWLRWSLPTTQKWVKIGVISHSESNGDVYFQF
jgi:hypothetical protein